MNEIDGAIDYIEYVMVNGEVNHCKTALAALKTMEWIDKQEECFDKYRRSEIDIVAVTNIQAKFQQFKQEDTDEKE